MSSAEVLAQLLSANRSIRSFTPQPLPPGLINQTLEAALQGSSSSGNLNMVSVVKTQDPERRQRLYELHFEQPMVLQAPLVLSFCADSFRTRQWLAQRDARLGFGDFLSWHVCSFDAIILAQTTALALESHGLGVCYMGTTLHRMGEIADFLGLPDHCLPVTSLVVGWPAEQPAQRDRLPAAAWIHDETYQRPEAEEINAHYAQRETRGWARYRAMGPEVAGQMDALGIRSLAQYYTSKIKYDPDQFREDSDALHALLASRGFLP